MWGRSAACVYMAYNGLLWARPYACISSNLYNPERQKWFHSLDEVTPPRATPPTTQCPALLRPFADSGYWDPALWQACLSISDFSSESVIFSKASCNHHPWTALTSVVHIAISQTHSSVLSETCILALLGLSWFH